MNDNDNTSLPLVYTKDEAEAFVVDSIEKISADGVFKYYSVKGTKDKEVVHHNPKELSESATQSEIEASYYAYLKALRNPSPNEVLTSESIL